MTWMVWLWALGAWAGPETAVGAYHRAKTELAFLEHLQGQGIEMIPWLAKQPTPACEGMGKFTKTLAANLAAFLAQETDRAAGGMKWRLPASWGGGDKAVAMGAEDAEVQLLERLRFARLEIFGKFNTTDPGCLGHFRSLWGSVEAAENLPRFRTGSVATWTAQNFCIATHQTWNELRAWMVHHAPDCARTAE
jgi:hypothetical protein